MAALALVWSFIITHNYSLDFDILIEFDRAAIPAAMISDLWTTVTARTSLPHCFLSFLRTSSYLDGHALP